MARNYTWTFSRDNPMTDLYQLRPLEWKEKRFVHGHGAGMTFYFCGAGDICKYDNNDKYLCGTELYDTLEEAKQVLEDGYPEKAGFLPASPASIVARYEELKQEGLIVTGQGSATVNIEGRQE